MNKDKQRVNQFLNNLENTAFFSKNHGNWSTNLVQMNQEGLLPLFLTSIEPLHLKKIDLYGNNLAHHIVLFKDNPQFVKDFVIFCQKVSPRTLQEENFFNITPSYSYLCDPDVDATQLDPKVIQILSKHLNQHSLDYIESYSDKIIPIFAHFHSNGLEQLLTTSSAKIKVLVQQQLLLSYTKDLSEPQKKSMIKVL